MKTTPNIRPVTHSRFLVLSLLLALLVLLIASCTRDRPASDSATPTPSPVEGTPAPAGDGQQGLPSRGEPEVTIATPDGSTEFTGSVAGASTEPTIRPYEVQPGDTLLSIAMEFGTTTERLRELNFLQSDLIQVGQVLDVPMLPPTPVPTPEPFYHEVKAGETLGEIAALYSQSWKDLMLANQLEDANALRAGMKLLIPGAVPEATDESTGAAAGGTDGTSAASGEGGVAIHKVRPGETLSQIAQIYGVTTSQIVTANNLTSRNVIRTNQELIIPGVSAADAEAARSVRHTVEVGESLSQIARQYGVEVSAIVKANGLTNPNSVYVGQQLIIPAGAE